MSKCQIMKYIVFLIDGAADYPIKKLNGKTPLMVAEKPNIDALTAKGRCGLFQTIPQNMPTGSAVANLSVLGYNSEKCFEGRGVLEAASMGVPIIDDEIGLRCNLICVEDGKIKNHSAGHISSEEAAILIDELNKTIGSKKAKFYPGVSYRHLLVIKDKKFSKKIKCAPPHDFPGEKIENVMISGDEYTSNFLNDLILRSNAVLENHPVNIARAENGKDKANYIWTWSAGKKPKMKTYAELYEKTGAVISAVDLIKGIGKYAGLDLINVEGATGLYDTNYEGKADACIEALKNHDFVFCHVEASDEAGHEGDVDLKIKTIEYFDKRLLGRALAGFSEIDDEITVAVLPDHFTPCELRIHTREAVPFIINDPGKASDDVQLFDEESCKKGSFGTVKNDEFIKKVFDE